MAAAKAAVRAAPSLMERVDNAISAIAPGYGLRRLESRAKLQVARAAIERLPLIEEHQAQVRAYEATIRQGGQLVARLYNVAQYDPSLDPRASMNGNPTDDVVGAMDQARRLVRDVMMNDPVAIRAREVRVDAVLGEGIQPRCDSRVKNPKRKDALDARVMDVFYDHAESNAIDVNGRKDWYQLQRQAEMTKCQDGEVLWLKVWNNKRDVQRKGLKHPLQYDLRECDWLASTVREWEDNGTVYPVIGGIEINPRTKERRAYHLYLNDPSKFGGTGETIRIPAKYVIHDADVQRIGQLRGWSIFAPVVPTFHDLKDLDDAGLKRAKIDSAMHTILGVPVGTPLEQSSIGGFGEKPGFSYGYEGASDGRLLADGTGLPVSSGGTPIAYAHSGMISRVVKGTDIHTIQPQASQVYEPVRKSNLRRVAMAVAQTYESVSLDYSDVTFISGRLAKGPVNRAMRNLQWAWVTNVGTEFWKDFIEGGYNMEAYAIPGLGPYWTDDQIKPKEVAWTLPTPDTADPEGEAKTQQMHLKMGKLSHPEMLRMDGKDPGQHYRDMKRGYEMAADNGIALDRFLFPDSTGKNSASGETGQEDPDTDPNDPDAAQDDTGGTGADDKGAE